MLPRASLPFLLTFALLPFQAVAQDALTIEDALKMAVARNAALRAVRSGGDEAEAQAAEVRSSFFPRVSVVESWRRGDDPVFAFSALLSARRFEAANFAIDRLNHPDAISSFRTSVGIEQIVFDGGRQQSAASVASLRRDIARSAGDEATAGVAVATVQTFGRIVSAEAARRVLVAALAAAREDRARAERRRDAGMATDADVLALAVHTADLEQRAIQSEGDEAVGRAELNRLLGEPIDREFRVVEPAAPFGGGERLDVLLAEADTSRPEIARATLSQKMADAARGQSRAALVPQVAAQAAIDFSGTQFGSRASSWIAGGQFQWTFSTGGGQLAGIKAAAAAAARAQAEAEDIRARVHVEVVGALRRLETARAREAAGRAAVEEARESQRITRDRFDAGVAGVTDVLRSSTALLDAEANRTAAAVDALIAAASLRQAVGRKP